MSSDFDIRDVVALFNLEVDPKARMDSTNFNVRCPFCNHKKYKCNINIPRNAYRCVVCGEGGGVLDLYARLKHGTRHVKGVNGKELEQELREALNKNSFDAPHKYPPRPAPVDIMRAPDTVVSATYQSLLEIPVFKLSEEHYSNLRKRGLSDTAIRKNGYCTFSHEAGRKLITKKVKEVYASEKIAKTKTRPGYKGILDHYSDEELQIGLAIANLLLKQKRKLSGVPGFFRLGKRWCFRFDDGLVVPTRNMQGEIVALQLRRDEGNLRYMTVSSKGLPKGVTVNISRAHFPLENAPIGPKTKVLLTEGPLKADVAIDLLRQDYHREDVAMIAIHGVNNTADLPGIFASLKEAGVETVYNALDTDKSTKYAVLKASRVIRDMIIKAALKSRILFWDDGHAAEKEEEWAELCNEYKLPLPNHQSVFARLSMMTDMLGKKGITPPKESSDWASSSKGIDDMLLFMRANHKSRSASCRTWNGA